MKDNKRRRSCKYHGWISGNNLTCDYILIEKQSRGCPAGPGCDKYKKGPKKKLPPGLGYE